MEKTVTQDETMRGFLEVADEVAAKYAGTRGSVIPVLQQVQERIGFLPPEVMERIGERLRVPPAQIFGVASFYAQFRFEPVGRHVIKVCHGTACHVQGATAITDALCDELGVADGGTTEDRRFTVESVACLGCCSLAPVMMIGEHTYARLTPDEARRIVRELED